MIVNILKIVVFGALLVTAIPLIIFMVSAVFVGAAGLFIGFADIIAMAVAIIWIVIVAACIIWLVRKLIGK